MAMQRFKFLCYTFCLLLLSSSYLKGQRGYYNAPYVRYEADQGMLNNASITPRSFNQANLQSEASEQLCVNLSNAGAYVQWTLTAEGDGLVVRYSVPDGQSGVLEVFANGVSVGTLNLSSYYSWEYLSTNGNPNNVGVVNANPKMRFDEVRMKLPSKIPAGGTLRLQRQSGNIHIDFAELESVPAAIPSAAGDVIYSGNGSDLQTFIDANGGRTIYLPAGVYNVNRELYFGVNNTFLKGAGMWYTQIHFTNNSAGQGGLRANAANISYSGLYLTTVRNSRSSSYKAINGVYTAGSRISYVWAEHFECGAWIGQYNAGSIAFADGFVLSHCRFRNNYADGINLCKGTRNSIVEYCNFRNNGDDDMAIWSADGLECRDNTFRYNTSENCWRASGCAIYGGYNNKAHNLLIRDNIEVGLRANNTFPGVGFSGSGMHEFYDITIIRCGTNNDLYNNPVGAIDLLCTNRNGTRVNNVKFSCISIIDSKNDAIYINRTSGEGFYNLIFENIAIDGTGREYPDNNAGTNTVRGFFIWFRGNPSGNGTYCNMSYVNRGGNATIDVNTSQIGTFSWTQAGACPGGCIQATNTVITSSSTFGVCNNPVTLTATTSAPSGNSVSYMEFFVNGVSIGQDNTSPYSAQWNNPSAGNHQVRAVAYYSPSGTNSASSIQNVTVADGIYNTTIAPVIDGVIEGLWNSYAPFPVSILSVGSISGPADLSANFRITRDAANLYILVDVTDDDLRNDGGNNWENDAVEIFIDMGNDKSGSYGANDFAYTFVINDPTVYESKHNATTGVAFAQGAKAGGYIMEIRIPWTTLGGAQSAGSFIGFDLHVNDDDGGGGRDAKKAWKDASDNAWQWPSVLGTLQIAGCANPLPVEFISFTAERKNEIVELRWVTANEYSNQKFIIERSDDLTEWIVIGEVAGAGTVASLSNYYFKDHDPAEGTVYYRLCQLDFNNEFSYSRVLVIERKNSGIIAGPNPFNEALVIKGLPQKELIVCIYDISGKIMYELSSIMNEDKLYIFPSLPEGVYFLIIKTESFVERFKLVKR
jgi:hypothetical protein